MENWNFDVDAYGCEVKLFLNGEQAREFRRIVAQLKDDFGTKNQTDTVLEALRQIAAANRERRYLTRAIRSDWRRSLNRAFSRALRNTLQENSPSRQR